MPISFTPVTWTNDAGPPYINDDNLNRIEAGIDDCVTALNVHTDLAREPMALIVGALTRSSIGVVTSAGVVWPDGTTGTYTADSINSQWLTTDGYHITYAGATTVTYTQPTVTRDSATGVVTNLPAIVVT